MLGLRKKILISDLIIFAILIALLFPFVGITVNRLFLLLAALLLFIITGALHAFIINKSEFKIVESGKDFISNASHELRTPITVIRGFAETLHDLPEISQDRLKDMTGKMIRTCDRLEKLVRSLLTLSDLENLALDRFRHVDLIAIAENCQHLLLSAYPDAKVTFKKELKTASILADADLLELAILNILENAVKYSQGPAEIEMTIFPFNKEVGLRIKDKGIGISEKDLPSLFDRFYRVDRARSHKSGGVGLGLSIVKTIIDKHNGKIHVTSELGKGSTFTIVLYRSHSKSVNLPASGSH